MDESISGSCRSDELEVVVTSIYGDFNVTLAMVDKPHAVEGVPLKRDTTRLGV